MKSILTRLVILSFISANGQVKTNFHNSKSAVCHIEIDD
jgi:hypothetical protein